MLIGDYYDKVMAESEKIASKSVNDVEQVKTAEAIAQLDEAGASFENEKEASAAINKIIDDDYAEKVASVRSELESDNFEFKDEQEKVSAAMEIVDGWEASEVKGEERSKLARTDGKKASELIGE